MAEQPLQVRPCSIAAALDIVGERWTLLVIREISYGVHQFARIAAYTGVSRDILADRLRKLEGAGLAERHQYSEHPPRFEYHLTEAGRQLFPLMTGLREWGDRWAVGEPAVRVEHDCGHPLEAILTCRHCGAPVAPASITTYASVSGSDGAELPPPALGTVLQRLLSGCRGARRPSRSRQEASRVARSAFFSRPACRWGLPSSR
jgi:DNA-binding HxlR family transcriptional regulator